MRGVRARGGCRRGGARGAQRSLDATDFSAVDGLRVRMALHTGMADERDGDYFGPAVNRVARLLAIGHGGQVLVSGVTADLVQGDMPAQATLHDLGAHRLKDLARPEQVYQLLAPDLQREFPPLRSLDFLPNNLPPQLTSFVGREREAAEIAAMIAPHRVVTLIGSGGVGKTRTSLQVGANLLDGSGDGVWFVEFAPLADPALVPTTIASTLGLTLPDSGDPLAALVNVLRPQRCLLILDNCEHLVDAAAAAVSAILRGCRRSRSLRRAVRV
ncbi:MAG: adenylate/guanylate cyclase domain-containing protein [Candidatus Eremiobacteraeota bacterium]|nr:adenylate/guanylate cyclase domain-containing protein [Candidatus Eremiobacteraeota bacterium]